MPHSHTIICVAVCECLYLYYLDCEGGRQVAHNINAAQTAANNNTSTANSQKPEKQCPEMR